MITLTNGYPQGPNGLIVPNGSISFSLNVDATVIANPGGFVCSDIPVVFQFNAAGQIQPNSPAAAAQIWSNAELNPQNSVGLGTYYLVAFFDQNGARLNQSPMWWQFPEAANATVDISEMAPYATVGGNVIFYPTIVALSIPPPTPITLGGVFSNAGIGSHWVSAINTDGSVSLSQPAFSDISGTISSGQLPSGFVAGTIAATQVAFGTGTDILGGSANFTWNNSTQQISLAAGDVFGGINIDATAVVSGASRVISITNIQSGPAGVIHFDTGVGTGDVDIQISSFPTFSVSISNGVGIFTIFPTGFDFTVVGNGGVCELKATTGAEIDLDIQNGIVISPKFIATGATPTTGTGQLGFGTTIATLGGSPGTSVTTNSAASPGPAAPGTVSGYVALNLAGTPIWVPYFV